MKGSKGKMWKKGHSCTFNPEFNKFRQEVKKGSFRFQGSIASKSNLTEASLAQHNNVTSASLCDKNDELMSVGGETAMTAFTNCTLPTFNRLQNSYNPRSILHNNEMALLAALAQTIKDKGEEETDANYFSLLVNSLDTFESDETLTAAMNINQVTYQIYEFRSLCFIETSFVCDLLFTESSRIAQHIIRSLLIEHKPVSLTFHPCANPVAQFCIEKIESSAGFGKSVSKDIFYIMQLLEETISAFKTSYIKKCYETISRVMLLNHSVSIFCDYFITRFLNVENLEFFCGGNLK
ncbi:RRP12-like protein [Caerostris extrusa]|uniref:RRP12-like protein n=1 Tax=Caerostris extrusa TaxID=172846 RepID=A0AAV4TZW4_CAEEX|nr:RRP12-like protein [Caerostris extrusa]